MKYLLIIIAFFLAEGFAQSSPSDNNENCAYATQGNHTVSNKAYDRLLAQLNQSNTKKKPNRSRSRSKKGQR